MCKYYEYNILNDYTFKIDLKIALSDDLEHYIRSNLSVKSQDKNDGIYSYIVIAHSYKDNSFKDYWEVKYNISQKYIFNTITIDECVSEIKDIIDHDLATLDVQRVVGFRQPPLECMLELYQPLINKIAKIQCEHWPSLQYEDVCQIAGLCMCILYQRHYFIHKTLLVKTVNNAVLLSLRKERLKPNMVSLSDPVSNLIDNDLTYADVIEDPFALEEMYESENVEADKELLERRKRAVIKYLGERTYNMLLTEYSTKTTSPYGRMIMNKVKQYFKKKGGKV